MKSFTHPFGNIVALLLITACGPAETGKVTVGGSVNNGRFAANADEILFDTTHTRYHTPNVQGALDETVVRLKVVENQIAQAAQATACPSGMQSIAGTKSCIDQNRMVAGISTTFTFETAHSNCVGMGKRLCTTQELQNGCMQKLLSPVAAVYELSQTIVATDRPILVELVGLDEANPVCTRAVSAGYITTTHRYAARCCK